MPTWYHGTASSTGMEIGDWIDPSRGAFEGGVWATSSAKIARQWALAACALHDDAEPLVFEVEVVGDVAEVDSDESDAPDADAVICARGEGGVPTLFIRAALTGRVSRLANF